MARGRRQSESEDVKEFMEHLRIFARDYLLPNDDKIRACAKYIDRSPNYLRTTILGQRRKGSLGVWVGVFSWIAKDMGSDLNLVIRSILIKDSPFSKAGQPSVQLFSILNRFKIVDEEVMLQLAQALHEIIEKMEANCRQRKSR